MIKSDWTNSSIKKEHIDKKRSSLWFTYFCYLWKYLPRMMIHQRDDDDECDEGSTGQVTHVYGIGR